MNSKIKVDDREVCATCLREKCEREKCGDRDDNGNVKVDGNRIIAVWRGVSLGDGGEPKDLEGFFDDTFGADVQYLETIVTKPDPGQSEYESGGRTDMFIAVAMKDIPSFAINRFTLESSPSWLDDVLDNEVRRHADDYGTWQDIKEEDDCPLYPVRVVKYLREDNSDQ